MFLADLFGDLLGSFADDLKFLDYCTGSFVIDLKRLQIHPCNEAIIAVDGRQNIFQV